MVPEKHRRARGTRAAALMRPRPGSSPRLGMSSAAMIGFVGSFQRTREKEPPISVEEAQQRVLAEVSPLDAVEVPLAEAHRRVLREDVVAPNDVPRADNRAMDGYAVRTADVVDVPATLRVIGDVPADRDPMMTVSAGTAVRIMTGAAIPAGADAVVPVEHTDAGGEKVRIDQSTKPGTNIRRRGEDMRKGEIVLRAGAPIGPGELGVLATV